MKLKVVLGCPYPESSLDMDKIKAVFPYGQFVSIDVVQGGLACSSCIAVPELGDHGDDMVICIAAVYVGY